MQATIAELKENVCELVDRAERGETIVILRHGKVIARLAPLPARAKPWRVEKPDVRRLYKGVHLEEPVLGG
jgi:antitoxin (DNA-binding transcriptional repressor) of toxin-antitoxin stability system